VGGFLFFVQPSEAGSVVLIPKPHRSARAIALLKIMAGKYRVKNTCEVNGCRVTILG
jgi:hypothetical protein